MIFRQVLNSILNPNLPLGEGVFDPAAEDVLDDSTGEAEASAGIKVKTSFKTSSKGEGDIKEGASREGGHAKKREMQRVRQMKVNHQLRPWRNGCVSCPRRSMGSWSSWQFGTHCIVTSCVQGRVPAYIMDKA